MFSLVDTRADGGGGGCQGWLPKFPGLHSLMAGQARRRAGIFSRFSPLFFLVVELKAKCAINVTLLFSVYVDLGSSCLGAS